MAGNHVLAQSHADELLSIDLPNQQAMLHRYNASCVFGRCYQATCRQADTQTESITGALSEKYLQFAIENLEKCWADGFFETQDILRLLTQDEDLATVRRTKKFQELMQKIGP